jgi:hypothetical protein
MVYFVFNALIYRMPPRRHSARFLLIAFGLIATVCTTIGSFPSMDKRNTGVADRQTEFHLIAGVEERHVWLKALHYIDLSAESALLCLPTVRLTATETFSDLNMALVFKPPFALPLIHAP